MPTINTALLRQAGRVIVAEPLRFDMGHYIEREAGAPCGTTACIAGWSIILDRLNKAKQKATQDTIPMLAEKLMTEAIKTSKAKDISVGDVFRKMGKKVLGIRSEKAAKALFYAEYWPEPYRERYNNADGPLEVAKIAVSRIEHFIKTKGKE